MFSFIILGVSGLDKYQIVSIDIAFGFIATAFKSCLAQDSISRKVVRFASNFNYSLKSRCRQIAIAAILKRVSEFMFLVSLILLLSLSLLYRDLAFPLLSLLL